MAWTGTRSWSRSLHSTGEQGEAAALSPRMLVAAACGLLLEAASLAGVRAFGPAFAAALVLAGAPVHAAASLAGALAAGLFLGEPGQVLLRTWLPAVLLWAGTRLPSPWRVQDPAVRPSGVKVLYVVVWLAGASLLSYLVGQAVGGPLAGAFALQPAPGAAPGQAASGAAPGGSLLALLSGSLSGVGACLLAPGAAVLAARPRAVREGSRFGERAALLLVATLGAAGAGALGASRQVPEAVPLVAAWWAVLSAGWLGGAGAGAAAGVAATVGLAGLPGAPLADLLAFAPAGLVAGAISHREGRLAGLLAAGAGLLVLLSLMDELQGGTTRPPWEVTYFLAGSGLFAITPRAWLAGLCRLFGELLRLPAAGAGVARLAERRLRDLARALHGLAVQVGRRPDKDRGEGSDWVEEVSRRACDGCPLFNRCWVDLQYTTYWDVLQLLAEAERRGRVRLAHFPPGLARRCIARPRVAAAVNQVTAWFRGRAEGEPPGLPGGGKVRGELPAQLHAVSELLSAAARELGAKEGEDETFLGRRLGARLARAGLRAQAVAVSGGPGSLEVWVRLRQDPAPEEVRRLATITAEVVGFPVTVSERRRSTGFARQPATELVLVPQPAVHFRWAAALRAKEGHGGDRVLEVPLQGGKKVILLADGMGTGRRGALESEVALLTVGRLLQVGLSPAAALRLGNSLLARRKQGEGFTALDLLVLDEFTGQADLFKCGAPPTFLRRGRRVEVLEGSAPPLGAVDPVEIDCRRIPLRPGDLLALVTDGVLEADPDIRNKEQWVSQLLCDVSGPTEAAARELLGRAAESGREPGDDMGVVLVGASSGGGSQSEEIPEYTRQVRSFRPVPLG